MQANGLISKTAGGRDKGVMKLETEVRRRGAANAVICASFCGRDLGRDMPPTAAEEMMMMLLLQMAHSSFGSPVQYANPFGLANWEFLPEGVFY